MPSVAIWPFFRVARSGKIVGDIAASLAPRKMAKLPTADGMGFNQRFPNFCWLFSIFSALLRCWITPLHPDDTPPLSVASKGLDIVCSVLHCCGLDPVGSPST